MFGTENQEVKATAQAKMEVKVEAARLTKNPEIIMIDIVANGVKIKSCMLKEATVKEDGKVHKKGDKVYFLNFPSEKVGDKYYNICWFPTSKELIVDICNQTKSLL
jgi:hypothetical protein